MKHFIYKTTHKNGKYYIGRHSTENIDDGYVGSGRWPRSIKDKSTLTRTILEFASDETSLKDLEGKYLAEHYGNPNCMNMTDNPIGFDSTNNPMKDPEVLEKFKGDNHWLRKYPNRAEEIRQHQLRLVDNGNHNLLGDKNPNKDGSISRKTAAYGHNIFQTNNPSVWRSEKGIHHWQNGKAPNTNGELNKKLVAEGKHNFLGPEHNRRMIAEGKNPWVGSTMNKKLLAEGRHPSQQKKTCQHCGKQASVGMFARWHGDNCRSKGETK